MNFSMYMPVDLKSGVIDGLARTLAPVEEYFRNKPENYEAMLGVLKGIGKLR